MPRAYSTDLRERALAAYEAGEGRQSEIARLYRIGERTLSGWLELAREEGRRSPKPRRGGRAPLGGERETLAGLVAERSDATLAEYADRLAERAGVRRSPSARCGRKGARGRRAGSRGRGRGAAGVAARPGRDRSRRPDPRRRDRHRHPDEPAPTPGPPEAG